MGRMGKATRGTKIPRIFLKKQQIQPDQHPLCSYSQRIFPPCPKSWDLGNEIPQGCEKRRKIRILQQSNSRITPDFGNVSQAGKTGISPTLSKSKVAAAPMENPWMQHPEKSIHPPPIHPWNPQEREGKKRENQEKSNSPTSDSLWVLMISASSKFPAMMATWKRAGKPG